MGNKIEKACLQEITYQPAQLQRLARILKLFKYLTTNKSADQTEQMCRPAPAPLLLTCNKARLPYLYFL